MKTSRTAKWIAACACAVMLAPGLAAGPRGSTEAPRVKPADRLASGEAPVRAAAASPSSAPPVAASSRTAVNARTYSAEGASLKRSVLAAGANWSRVRVEGTVGSVRFSEDAEYFVVRGLDAIREVPLRQVVGAEFEAFVKDALAREAGSRQPEEQLYVMYRPALQAAEKVWLDRDVIFQDPTAAFDRTICVPNPGVGLNFTLPELNVDTVIREIRPGVLFSTAAAGEVRPFSAWQPVPVGVVASTQPGGLPLAANPSLARAAAGPGSGVVGSAATSGAGAGKTCFNLRDTMGQGSQGGGCCCAEFPQVYRECSKRVTLNLTPPEINIDEPKIDSPSILQGFFEGTMSFQARTSFRSPGSGSKGLGAKINVAYGTVFCIPVWVRPVDFDLWSHADVSVTAGLDGTLKLSKSFEMELSPVMLSAFIGPGGIPLFVDIPLTVGVDAELQTPALTRFTVRSGVKTGFEVSCRLGGNCKNTVQPYFEKSTATPPGNPEFDAQAHVIVEPFVRSGLRASVLAPGFVYASVGPRLFTRMDFWGAAKDACGDADGDGQPERVAALTADHDIGANVLAEIGIGEQSSLSNPIINSISFELWRKQEHLFLFDLGGGPLFEPLLTAPAQTVEDRNAVASVAMRPCWPYSDEVVYRLNWGDGTTSTVSGSPQEVSAKEHAWSNPNTYQVLLEARKDTHGREFARIIRVGGGGSGNPATASRTVRVTAASDLSEGRAGRSVGSGMRPAGSTSGPRATTGRPRTSSTQARPAVPSGDTQSTESASDGDPTGAVSSSASSGKRTKKGGGGLGTLDPSTVDVKAEDKGTTAVAIRGMTAPQDARVASVDLAARIVTARIAATGQVVRFRVDASRLSRLAVGQKVWTDVAAGAVSLDGATTCCRILAAPARAPAAKPTRPSRR